MTDEPEAGPSQRRNFTDVASLFQPIVPVDGRRLPDAENGREGFGPEQRIGGSPPLEPYAPEGAPEWSPHADPPIPPASEPASASGSFPDEAGRRRRPWRLALVMVVGVLAALAFWVGDPAVLRRFVAEHRSPPAANRPAPPSAPAVPPSTVPPSSTSPSPSAPSPSAPSLTSPDATSPSPTSPSPTSPSPTSPSPASPSPGPAPASPPQAASTTVPPAAPGSGSEPEPPQTALPGPGPTPPQNSVAPTPEPAAPPAETRPPAPPPNAGAQLPGGVFGRVTIRYRRGVETAEGDAGRIANTLIGAADRVELRAGPLKYRIHTVVYHRPEDREAAESLAQRTAAPGKPWTVRADRTRQPPGTFEVWIP